MIITQYGHDRTSSDENDKPTWCRLFWYYGCVGFLLKYRVVVVQICHLCNGSAIMMTTMTLMTTMERMMRKTTMTM